MHFFKGLSYTFISSIIYAAAQWAIIAMIGRIIGIDGLGVYSLALGIALPVNMFFNFGVRQIICSDVVLFSQKSYLNSVLLFQSIGLVVVFFISKVFYSDYIGLMVLVYLVKIVESICEVTNGFHQREENFKLIAISRIARSTFAVIVSTISLYVTHDLAVSVFSQLIVSLISIFIFDIKFDNSSAINPRLYQVGFPLAVAGFLVSQKLMIPRILLEEYSDMTNLGIFSSITYIVSAGGLVVTSISQVIIPKINKNTNELTRALIIKKWSFVVTSLAILSSAFLCLFSDVIFSILFKSKVALNQADIIFLVFLLITTFISSFLGYMASALRQLNRQPFIYAFLILLMTIIFYLLKLYLSILYAIYGSVIITNFVQVICLLYLVKNGIKNENSTCD